MKLNKREMLEHLNNCSDEVKKFIVTYEHWTQMEGSYSNVKERYRKSLVIQNLLYNYMGLTVNELTPILDIVFEYAQMDVDEYDTHM